MAPDPAALPPFPLGVPTRLRPVELLGHGSTSTVWRVRDTATGRELALKVVAPVPGSRIDPARRAETEARALARLGPDPGVVQLLEVGRTDDGEAYLVQQLVQGPTLAELAPLASARAATIGAAVAATLARAHAAGVSHGDVTPHNVVLGPDGAPLLIDFGMAGLGHAPDDPGGLTPAFAAPERLRGAPPSPAADVYSLATTLLGVLGALDARGRALLDGVLRTATSDEPAARPDAGAVADALGSVSRR